MSVSKRIPLNPAHNVNNNEIESLKEKLTAFDAEYRIQPSPSLDGMFRSFELLEEDLVPLARYIVYDDVEVTEMNDGTLSTTVRVFTDAESSEFKNAYSVEEVQ